MFFQSLANTNSHIFHFLYFSCFAFSFSCLWPILHFHFFFRLVLLCLFYIFHFFWPIFHYFFKFTPSPSVTLAGPCLWPNPCHFQAFPHPTADARKAATNRYFQIPAQCITCNALYTIRNKRLESSPPLLDARENSIRPEIRKGIYLLLAA